MLRNCCFIFLFWFCLSCSAQNDSTFQTGAERTDLYLQTLETRRIGLMVNPSSRIGPAHLVDSLLGLGLDIKKIFSPEHGFRGTADAGERIESGTDRSTGLPVISLYGSNKKPSPSDLEGLDVLIFDLQDVGVRFYTYASSMHYLMEACAENDIPVMVFDRPNPNGDYVDGPVLDLNFQSFVGMHPIPVIHGLTLGELARMINEEGWLKNGIKCDLEVIPMKDYRHDMVYQLPVKPSPNLPNYRSVRLYPSLCFFEGTVISVGRGTYDPFQMAGYPDPSFGEFTFVPKSIPGMSKNPKHQGKTCYGLDLRETEPIPIFTLEYLIKFYQTSEMEDEFFNAFFDKLAGTDQLRKKILEGWSEDSIRKSWDSRLIEYHSMRQKYLLYP